MSFDEVQQGADVFDIPEYELEVPPQKPDAHNAIITSIERVDFDSGTTGIKINLHSTDEDFDTDFTLFPPAEYVANPNLNPKDPEQLSNVVPVGKKQSPQQRYAAVVLNSNKTADLQKLREIARQQGREPNAEFVQGVLGKARAETFDDVIAVHNALLQNATCVFTRRPDKNDDVRFNGRLRVSAIIPTAEAYDPKALKKYRKAWAIEA